MPPEERGPGVLVRLRRTGLAILGAVIVAWLAWPLVGLLATWLRLPPDFRPLATGLLGLMIVVSGVTGWFWDPDRDG